ncbi:TetR/AcrR family transcriptional regulator [Roseomonas sp. WA12]
MTGDGRLKRQRRKDARPGEIIDAAMDVFAEKGFAAAKLDEVASRAGVAKGTLYRYFETKDDLFRAVARRAIASNLEAMQVGAEAFEGSLAEFVPVLLARFASTLGDSRLPAIARMVISESRSFPDLARIWHDDVASKALALLSGIIARGQKRGEIREGDPQLHAFSIIGPMMMGMLFREIFGEAGGDLPDMSRLAELHAETVLRGLRAT